MTPFLGQADAGATSRVGPKDSWSLEVSPARWDGVAACRSLDPEVFFPAGYGREHLQLVEQAKAVCAHCKVSPQCLELALSTDQAAGIWGGRTPLERTRLRRADGRHALIAAAGDSQASRLPRQLRGR